jgi:hypothetical protein
MSLQKLTKIYIQTKLDGELVDINTNSVNLLRKAETDGNTYKFKKDIYFCVHKSMVGDKPAIIIIFTIKLPDNSSGSSASSELIMNLVSMLENSFSPIYNYWFSRNVDGINKNIAVLKIVKLSDCDILMNYNNY